MLEDVAEVPHFFVRGRLLIECKGHILAYLVGRVRVLISLLIGLLNVLGVIRLGVSNDREGMKMLGCCHYLLRIVRGRSSKEMTKGLPLIASDTTPALEVISSLFDDVAASCQFLLVNIGPKSSAKIECHGT